MAATPSTMVPLGTLAPTFTLPNVNGGLIRLDLSQTNPSAKGFLICFICNHCPYVKHIEQEFVRLAEEAMQSGIQVYAISSNDAVKYPEDAPDQMAAKHYPFPYLHDESQDVAKAYDAVCTPDFFLYDAEYRLVYRGQFDDSRPGNSVAPDGRDLRVAIEALLQGKEPIKDQRPSIGCNIKWK